MTDRTAADAARHKAERRKYLRSIGISYLFMLPYLLLLAMFGVVPVLYAFGLSFTDTIEGTFYGLRNYAFVFSDFRILRSVGNVLAFVAFWVTSTLLFVAALSLMLDTLDRRTAAILRTIYFIPGAVTSSAIVVLWLFMLDPGTSPFSYLLEAAGWDSRQEVVAGLGMAGIFALMAFYAGSGGWIVVFGGALSSLPGEVIEAARVDGANRFQMALRIKLPMIWRSLVLMCILTFAGGLQVFVEPQLLGLAGSSFTVNDWSLNQLAFEYAFKMGDFGAAAALSTMMTGLCVAVAMIVILRTNFYKID